MTSARLITAALLLGAAPFAFIAAAPLALARDERPIGYDLDAQALSSALRTVAARAGRQIIVADDDVAGRTAPALKGEYRLADALGRLLEGSGLRFTVADGVVLVGTAVRTGDGEANDVLGIIVTGSRVRGAPPASPLIRITQEDIRAAGHADLGAVARSLPQSSGAGQNPGVGLGPPIGSENITGGSSLNLRGIGADATLTLLNGHRLSYASNNQSVDISAIPVAAVDAIEILADGASAIYGSDAVGGVANVRLKRAFSGLSTSARIGAATEGGGVQQQYSAVTGGRWSTGSVLITADYEKDTAILAKDRDYITSMAPAAQLLPGQKRYGVLAAGQQQLSDTLRWEFDGLYQRRRSHMDVIFGVAETPQSNALVEDLDNRSGAVSSRLILDLPGQWSASASGLAAFDEGRYAIDRMLGGVALVSYSGCYCNTALGLDATVEGPLFALPGGRARVALGGGYRYDRMHAQRDGVFDFTASRDSYFGYGELHLPFVSAQNAAPLLDQLSLTAAIRYEKYPGHGGIATPKLGVIYGPTPALSLKASWGKSYKQPTLYQAYFPSDIYLYDATDLGCTDCAAGATGMEINGGNPNLRPERATSWSATIAYQPPFVPGLDLELSYFHIDYRNRVVLPIPTSIQSFDPMFAPFLERNPSPQRQAEVIAAANAFYDISTVGYDPANVAVIVDDRFVNSTRQSIWGLDMSARYRARLDADTEIAVMLTGAYLRSREQFAPGAAAHDLSGTIYDPPRLRIRSGATLTRAGLSLSGFVNRIGGVRNTVATPATRLKGMTTADVTIAYATGEGSGVDISLSAQNLFNARPALFPTRSAIYLPYDGTNYSAVGRFVSFSISKHW